MDSGHARSTCVEAAGVVVRMNVRVSRANEGYMAKVQAVPILAASGEQAEVVLTDGTGAAVVGLAVRKDERGAGAVVQELGVAMSGQQCCPCWPSSRCMAMS